MQTPQDTETKDAQVNSLDLQIEMIKQLHTELDRKYKSIRTMLYVLFGLLLALYARSLLPPPSAQPDPLIVVIIVVIAIGWFAYGYNRKS